MTIGEAIKILNTDHLAECEVDAERFNKAYNMAIKALEQQPCEDCISRQAVLDAMNTYDKFGYTETGCFVREPEGDYVPYIHYDDVIKCIKNAQPVTPKEKTGHWIERKLPMMIHDWKCDQCRMVTNERTYYCPNCGARMVSE